METESNKSLENSNNVDISEVPSTSIINYKFKNEVTDMKLPIKCRKTKNSCNNLNEDQVTLYDTVKICCIYCSNLYYTYEKYKEHLKLFHNNKESNQMTLKYKCPFCNTVSTEKSGIMLHIGNKHPDSSYLETDIQFLEPKSCQICFLLFKSNDSLIIHYKNIHNIDENDFNVEKCEIKLKTILNCIICNFSCSNCHSMNIHINQHRINQGIKIRNAFKYASKPFYQCQYCSVQCEEIDDMIKHKKNHHINRIHQLKNVQISVFKCPHCKMFYNTKSTLETHIYEKHNKNAQDVSVKKCNFCNKLFVNLDKHLTDYPNGNCTNIQNKQIEPAKKEKPVIVRKPIKLRKPKKPRVVKKQYYPLVEPIEPEPVFIIKNRKYYCPICNESKSNKNKMENHISEKHCDFNTAAAQVINNYTTCTSKKYECDICKKRFYDKDVLESHVEIEMLTLEKPHLVEFKGQIMTIAKIEYKNKIDNYCTKLLFNNKKYQNSFIKDTKNIYKCPLCNKKSIDKTEMIDHFYNFHNVKGFLSLYLFITCKYTDIFYCNICPKHLKNIIYYSSFHFIQHFDTIHDKKLPTTVLDNSKQNTVIQSTSSSTFIPNLDSSSNAQYNQSMNSNVLQIPSNSTNFESCDEKSMLELSHDPLFIPNEIRHENKAETSESSFNFIPVSSILSQSLSTGNNEVSRANVGANFSMLLCELCKVPVYFTNELLFQNHYQTYHANDVCVKTENFDDSEGINEMDTKFEIEYHDVPMSVVNDNAGQVNQVKEEDCEIKTEVL